MAERAFRHAFRGFTARLDKTQRAALLADPKVLAVVPDEVIEIAGPEDADRYPAGGRDNLGAVEDQRGG